MAVFPTTTCVDASKLAAIFSSTTNSYKFLLFRAILDELKISESPDLDFEKLAIRGLAKAWYTCQIVRLSFGSQDRIQKWILTLGSDLPDLHSQSDNIESKLIEKLTILNQANNHSIRNFLKDFARYVPYRLLEPWAREGIQGCLDQFKNQTIATLSAIPDYQFLYAISKNQDKKLRLTLHPEWMKYLTNHIGVVEGFWRSEFLDFLQRKNPNVLSLVSKIEPPLVRNLSGAKKIIDTYLQKKNMEFSCFYSGAENTDLSLDHFFPWSFMGHDKIWNIAMAAGRVNSSKNDNIPDRQKYLVKFADFHSDLLNTLREDKKLTEDYFTDLKIREDDIGNLERIRNIYSETYQPLEILARNQGFSTGWISASTT